MGDSERGLCGVCGEIKDLNRKYFHYNIKCECHSPDHFEIVWHCNECLPIEPVVTSLSIRTDELNYILKE